MTFMIPGEPGLVLVAPDLTAAQTRLLLAIAEGGATYRELGDTLRQHWNATWGTLRILERKGYVTRERFKARTIRLAKPLEWREIG